MENNITKERLVANGFTCIGGFMGTLFRLKSDSENTYLRDYGHGLYCFVSQSKPCVEHMYRVEREITTMDELQLCLDFCGFMIKLNF